MHYPYAAEDAAAGLAFRLRTRFHAFRATGVQTFSWLCPSKAGLASASARHKAAPADRPDKAILPDQARHR